MTSQQTKPIPQIYGADWCPDTKAVTIYLRTIGVKYDYFNYEQDARAAEVVKQYNEKDCENIPVVLIADDVLITPSIKELNVVLDRHGLLQF